MRFQSSNRPLASIGQVFPTYDSPCSQLRREAIGMWVHSCLFAQSILSPSSRGNHFILIPTMTSLSLAPMSKGRNAGDFSLICTFNLVPSSLSPFTTPSTAQEIQIDHFREAESAPSHPFELSWVKIDCLWSYTKKMKTDCLLSYTKKMKIDCLLSYTKKIG